MAESDPYVETLEMLQLEARVKRTAEIGLAFGSLHVRWNTELRPGEYRYHWHCPDFATPAAVIVGIMPDGRRLVDVNAATSTASKLVAAEVTEADALALIRGEESPTLGAAFEASGDLHAGAAQIRAVNRAAWESRWIGPRGRIRRTVDVNALEVEFSPIKPDTI